MGIAAVSFKEKNGIEIVVYPQGEWDCIDFDTASLHEGTDMITYRTKENVSGAVMSKLDIATSVDGNKILRLRETATYTCRQKSASKDDSDLICRVLYFQNEKNNVCNTSIKYYWINGMSQF